MSSVEFFSLVKEHLAPGGVMGVNMNMYSDDTMGQEDTATINTYLADTISSVFENVVVVDVTGSTNKELFATDSSDFLDIFADNADKEENEKLKAMMEKALMSATYYDAGDNIMTDDKAPVELLGMKQIDSIIKDEVSYYKEIYKRDGIQGLINSL